MFWNAKPPLQKWKPPFSRWLNALHELFGISFWKNKILNSTWIVFEAKHAGNWDIAWVSAELSYHRSCQIDVRYILLLQNSNSWIRFNSLLWNANKTNHFFRNQGVFSLLWTGHPSQTIQSDMEVAALYTAYTVYTFYTVNTICTVNSVNNVFIVFFYSNHFTLLK